MEDDLLVIGKIIGTHGTEGKMRVHSDAESHATFSAQDFLYLKGRKGDIRRYELTHIRPHKNVLLLELDGVSSISEAKELVGASILVEKSKLPPPAEDEYYWFDIIGLEVFTDNGTFLGTVKRILQTGSNDVYVIGKEEKEYLIPAIADVVTNIDVGKKTMIVCPLEGLFGDGEI